MNAVARINSWLFFLFFSLLPTQLGKHFFMDFSYVNGVRIDYLAPTLYLTDFVVIALIVVNWKMIMGSTLRFFTPFRMTLVAILMGVNISLAQEPIMALYTTVRYVEMWMVFVMIRGFFANAQNDKIEILHLQFRMTAALFIGALVQFGLSIYQISAQQSAQGLFYWLGERAFSISTPGIATISLFDTIALRPYGTFSHPNSLGGFYALIYVFFLISRFKLPRRVEIMRYGLVVLSGFLVLMSFSKMAIGTILLVTLYYVLRILKIDCWWCKWGRVFTLSIISLVFLSGKSDIVSLDKRVALAQSSLHTIAQHPFFGTGLGNSLYSQSVMSQQLSYFFLQPVHNIFLLFASEAGLILSVVIAFIVWREIRGKKKAGILKQVQDDKGVRDDNGRVLISILAVIVITGSFDHYWLTLIQNQLLLAVILGIGLRGRFTTTLSS